MDRATFVARERELRTRLMNGQRALAEAGLPLVSVLAGGEGAGRGQTLNFLLDWFDSRGVETHAMGPATEEERERPGYYRFWRRLPAKGSIGIFVGSWYRHPIRNHSRGKLSEARFEDKLRQVTEFERLLTDDGVLLVKLWLHITKKQQRRRFRKLQRNPDTRWRVTREDWELHRNYDQFLLSASRALRRTDYGHAPWSVIESANRRYRHIAAAEVVIDAIERRLAANHEQPPAPEEPQTPAEVNILSVLDLSRSVPRNEYRLAIGPLQARVARLTRDLTPAGRSAVCVFEGSDAAGKGGAIRRLTQAIDARYYRVIPISAPTDEEAAHPYLWRFWRQLPRAGHLTIYDRSWYGRVLVERIEGYATPDEWRRAYSEINAFEEQLVDSGVILLKFWLAIDKDEQLRRFHERESNSWKRYKLGPEDWRNREKWDAYIAAACDAIDRTSSDIAPWTLVEANDKYHARLKVLRRVEEALASALGRR